MRVLLIEDEAPLRAQIAGRLQAAGWQVDGTGDGREGLYLASEYGFDVAVVDLGLPGLSGLEVIRRLRQAGSRLPLLVLTARNRWQDRVEGLEAGADDYLGKPFQPEELLARLRALLRRAADTPDNRVALGALTLDLERQQLCAGDTPVELTGFEYRLLEHLALHRGRVLSKQALADRLYERDDERDSNVIEVLIGRLRRKLGTEGGRIETLRGRGYRLRADDP